MRKILLTVVFILAFSAIAFAGDTQTILVGEESPVIVPDGAVCESENEEIVTVKDDMIKGVSPGETDIHIKEKRLLKDRVVEKIHIVVSEDAVLCIKPEEEIDFIPEFELCDSSKKEIQEFTVNENLRLQPGTYYIKESTWYSPIEDYQEVKLAEGERKNISFLLQEPTMLKFEALDEDLVGEEVVLWNKSGDKFKKLDTLKIGDDQKTEELKVRSGDYCWEIKGDKIKPPVTEPVEQGKHKLYPFSVSGNPLTIRVSETAATIVSESVTFSDNAAGNARKIYDELTGSYSCPPIAACAIIGNMYGESGIRPYALENGGGGHGLCQWTGGRWNNLQSYASSKGQDWTNIDIQIEFLMKELSDMNMYEFWNAETVDEATELFMRKFERPASWVYATSLPRRVGAAKAALQAFAGEQYTETTTATTETTGTNQ